MINIIISVKGLQKISDRQITDVCRSYIISVHRGMHAYKKLLLPMTGTTVPDKQQVPDKWRDACKLPKVIKFGAVSYNN